MIVQQNVLLTLEKYCRVAKVLIFYGEDSMPEKTKRSELRAFHCKGPVPKQNDKFATMAKKIKSRTVPEDKRSYRVFFLPKQPLLEEADQFDLLPSCIGFGKAAAIERRYP